MKNRKKTEGDHAPSFILATVSVCLSLFPLRFPWGFGNIWAYGRNQNSNAQKQRPAIIEQGPSGMVERKGVSMHTWEECLSERDFGRIRE